MYFVVLIHLISRHRIDAYFSPVKQNNYFVCPSKNKRSPICRLLQVFGFFGKAVWPIIHVFLYVYAEKRGK